MIQNIFDSLLHILDQTIPALQGNGILLYIAALAISTFIFFLFRAIFLWYWKINALIQTLEQIVTTIAETNAILRYNSKQNSSVDLLKKELAKEKSSSLF